MIGNTDPPSRDEWSVTDYRQIFSTADMQQVKFVMDTGASRSVVSDAGILHNMRRISSTLVYGKGSTVIQWKGDVILRNHRGSMVVIRDVLLDPDCPVNVLSMRRMCQMYGMQGMHDADKYRLYHPNRPRHEADVLIGKAEPYDISDHYYLKALAAVVSKPQESVQYSSTKESAQIWHQRFGHLSYSSLSKLLAMVQGISTTAAEFKAEADKVCDVCMQGKQTRLPFASADTVCTEPLELVHMDLMGPLPVETHDASM